MQCGRSKLGSLVRLQAGGGGTSDAAILSLGKIIQPNAGRNEGVMMMTVEPGQTAAALRDLVKRIPQWVRDDLNATDPMLRERAEDTLVAMIAALVEQGPS